MSTAPELADQSALIARAQGGNSLAFEQLVAPHVPALRRMTLAFCRSRTDADDLAQEALLKAFRSLHTFNNGTSIGPWLFAVTRSVCHDWYRHRKVRGREHEVELDDECGERNGAESEPMDQHQKLQAKAEADRLWSAIRRLDPTYRIPLVLFDIEGLSYEEIARIERVRVGTVRSRLFRARKQLATLLSEDPAFAPESSRSGTFSPIPSSAPLRAVK